MTKYFVAALKVYLAGSFAVVVVFAVAALLVVGLVVSTFAVLVSVW